MRHEKNSLQRFLFSSFCLEFYQKIRSFFQFLEDSTAKLGLNGHARRAFNYRGDEITSLKICIEKLFFVFQLRKNYRFLFFVKFFNRQNQR